MAFQNKTTQRASFSKPSSSSLRLFYNVISMMSGAQLLCNAKFSHFHALLRHSRFAFLLHICIFIFPDLHLLCDICIFLFPIAFSFLLLLKFSMNQFYTFAFSYLSVTVWIQNLAKYFPEGTTGREWGYKHIFVCLFVCLFVCCIEFVSEYKLPITSQVHTWGRVQRRGICTIL